MDEMEKLTRRRSISLFFSALAFLVWQGGMTVSEWAGGHTFFHTLGDSMSVVGSLLWIGAMIYFVRFQRKVKKARAGCVLDDEWARNVRAKAITSGYFITFVVITISYIALSFMDIPVRGIVHLIFVVVIVAPLFSYVVIERRADGMAAQQ